MQIINLCPHTINETTTGRSFPPSGQIARVNAVQSEVCKRNGIPVYYTTFGEISGLPDKQPDTFYIVSAIVLNATDRTDVMAPGNIRRDEDKQPIGCQGFRLNQ